MHPLARTDTFTLSHGGNTVHLRASLRAALRLERLHDGFGPLFQKLDQFDTVTVRQIITTATTDQRAAEAFLGVAAIEPLSKFQSLALGPLVALCGAFLPAEAEDVGTSRPGKPMTWAEVYAELYQIGTGWIGWTPAETLDATPAEITEALTGFVAMRRAIHGTSDDDTDTPDQRAANLAAGLDPDFDRAGLEALKNMMG